MQYFPEEMDEFDMNFYVNNPDVIKSQKFYRENFEKVKELCSFNDDYFSQSDNFYVNLPYLNNIKPKK